MPSTYTTSGIEKIATGEQSGTWGATTNTNLDIINRLVDGVGAISLSGTTHTLTTSDGSLSDGQYAVLVFGGSPSGTNTVTISPNDAPHLYVVKNNSGESVVLTQGSGGNVTVENGKSAVVYADGAGSGAAVVDVSARFNVDLTAMDITATASEINVLDGITSTTAELNILDGVTATSAELNYLDITTLGTSEASKAVTASSSAKVTLVGTTSIAEVIEKVTLDVSTSGTYNFDALTQAAVYMTADQVANRTLNFRGNGSTSLDSIMATGESMTFAVLATQGATAYYFTTVQVDGSTVTPKWSFGVAPTSGNVNSIDAYTFTIIKTGSASFVVLASQSAFA